MLKVQNLTVASKESGKKLLEKVCFYVDRKEIHAILGKNGSGKSTLAYALMGLSRFNYQGGTIKFQGKNIEKVAPHKRAKMGLTLAFQEPARFEGLTVKDFLQAGKKNATAKQMETALELVGLESKEFLARRIDEKLSGGERKRIELASIMIMKPKLMILDEPDASLDIIVYSELYELLLNIKEKIGCSIILITHREEAGLIADSATLIDGGKVVVSGAFRHVMRQYCAREGKRDRCLAYKRRSIE